uniref:NADP-dependent oxidoreductase domain-containing protein n=1 Tax=Alexandrium monilatum TaxID=311494 RepID=A0A7S4WEC8_9DINO
MARAGRWNRSRGDAGRPEAGGADGGGAAAGAEAAARPRAEPQAKSGADGGVVTGARAAVQPAADLAEAHGAPGSPAAHAEKAALPRLEPEQPTKALGARGSESRWRRGTPEQVPEAPGPPDGLAAEAPKKLLPSSSVTLRSGLQVPVLGLGTRQLSSGSECREAVRAALRCGYRLIDTAPGYGNEEDVGHGIRAASLKREDVFLVTKLPPADHGDADDVEDALRASLKRLGTDYVDLYLVQSPKGGSVIWTWDAMLEMRSKGLARAVGVCNFGAEHLRNLAVTGRELPEVNQVELHFAQQQRALTSHCVSQGIALMAACPLARARLFRTTPPLTELAARKSRGEAELAVRWCLQKGFVTIPKSKDAKRIEANAAFGFSLTAAEMAEMDALDRGFSASSATAALELPWTEAVGEAASEVSDGDVGQERVRRRRRRRRRAKGKGKGKGKPAGAADTKGLGGKGGGTAATRAAAVLFSLS